MNKISFIVGLAILFAGSCKKDEDKPSTTTGTDVVCTVNGKDWKVGKNDSFNIDGNPDNKGAAIVARLSGSNLSFSINKYDNVDSAAVVLTAVVSDSVLGNYEFNYSRDPSNMHYIRYIKFGGMGGPPPSLSNSVGFIKITAYDNITGICSGEFEAVVTNRDFMGRFSTANISKGKFTNIKLQTP